MSSEHVYGVKEFDSSVGKHVLNKVFKNKEDALHHAKGTPYNGIIHGIAKPHVKVFKYKKDHPLIKAYNDFGNKQYEEETDGEEEVTEEAAESTEEALEAIYESDEPEQFAHRGTADEAHANELLNVHSYVDQKGASPNKYGFVGQQHGAITKNLDKKKAKGVYDHEKAKKLFGYYAKSLSDHYAKHHGGNHATPATRALVASKLADRYHSGEQHSEEEEPTINRYSELTPEQAEEIVSENRFLNRPVASKQFSESEQHSEVKDFHDVTKALSKHGYRFAGKGLYGEGNYEHADGHNLAVTHKEILGKGHFWTHHPKGTSQSKGEHEGFGLDKLKEHLSNFHK